MALTREIVIESYSGDGIGVSYTYASYHINYFNLGGLFTDKIIDLCARPGSTDILAKVGPPQEVPNSGIGEMHEFKRIDNKVYGTGSIFHPNSVIAEI